MHSFFNIRHLFLGLILVSYFAFGLYHVTQFITADEHYWVYERIPQYWKAIAEHKWKKTFINDKPGVSLALVSGIGYFLHPDSTKHCEQNDDKFYTCKTDETETLYFAFRLPILLINGVLLILCFFLISKLTNSWIALWSTMLIALSPILLGISQIVNPDALLWSFGSIGIFSFLVVLKYPEKKYIALAALFTGLALLSKYTAIILLPFYLLLITAYFLIAPDEELPTPRATLLRQLFSFSIIAIVALGILCFFLPAILLNPKTLGLFFATIPDKTPPLIAASVPLILFLIDTCFFHSRFLIKLRAFCRKHLHFAFVIPAFFLFLFTFVILTRHLFPDWNIFTQIPFDIKNITNSRYYGIPLNTFQSFLLEWSPLVFSLTPITLFGLGNLWIHTLRSKNNQYLFLSSLLPLLILIYISILLHSNILATVRYTILLYPIFSVLAALGFWHIAKRFAKYPLSKLLITALIFIASVVSIIFIRPFYFNYTNLLLPQKIIINDAWGYGGYEAAQYLNTLPNAKNSAIWSDYYGVCEFFVGRCLTAYTFDKEKIKPDYYVLTRRGGIRYMSKYDNWEMKSGLTAYKYYNVSNPDWQLFIGNHPGNFIKVIKVEK